MNDTLQRYDRELEAKWQNQRSRLRDTPYPKPSEGASALIASACFAGLVLIGFICFMNWAIPLVKK